MNKRKLTIILAAGLALSLSAAAQMRPNQRTGTQSIRTQNQAARLRAGEAAIYLRSGDLFVDRVTDISSTRLVLQTANSGEFQLRDVWMINFIDEGWDFPQERDQLETNEHYVFLRDGGIIAGRIVDFSSAQRVFEMRNGEKIEPARIRRIYFSRQVPAGLAGRENDAAGGRGGGDAADQVVGNWSLMSGSRTFRLQLNGDGGARLTYGGPGGQNRVATGRWGFKRGDDAIVVVEINSGRPETLTFGRDGDMLIGIVYDKDAYGPLRLRRR